MKAIAEGMGMDWASQFTKLKSNPIRWGIVEIAIPSAGGLQSMVCIALYKLASDIGKEGGILLATIQDLLALNSASSQALSRRLAAGVNVR